jgi:hypothetical protein
LRRDGSAGSAKRSEKEATGTGGEGGEGGTLDGWKARQAWRGSCSCGGRCRSKLREMRKKRERGEGVTRFLWGRGGGGIRDSSGRGRRGGVSLRRLRLQGGGGRLLRFAVRRRLRGRRGGSGHASPDPAYETGCHEESEEGGAVVRRTDLAPAPVRPARNSVALPLRSRSRDREGLALRGSQTGAVGVWEGEKALSLAQSGRL